MSYFPTNSILTIEVFVKFYILFFVLKFSGMIPFPTKHKESYISFTSSK